MLLNDIGKSPDATFRRINQHLETNYGFKISEDVTDKDLVSIMEQIQDEITDLKIKGDDAKGSPEISKRLLVLEGIRSLREFALQQFQSPDLGHVIDGMTDFVVNHFSIAGSNESDFEEAIRDAMKHYRSSKYRFPDDMIEQRIRQGAMAKLAPGAASSNPQDMSMMEGDPFINTPQGSRQRDSAGGGHAGSIPDTDQVRHKMQSLDNSELSLGNDNGPAQSTDQVPMIRDKHGRMVPDPFKAQAAQRRIGISNVRETISPTLSNKSVSQKRKSTMKEHAQLVKNLRRLLETEVSQAEVMMAAKGFAQELQEMVEKIGRLQNEDLPPVTDQMRETYGMESASAFQTQIYGALQSVMDALYTAKGQVDDAVGNMAARGEVSAVTDMDLPVDGMDDAGMDDAGMDDMDPDLDNIGADLEADATDEFGGADSEEPMGRAMKTEARVLRNKVLEMKKLVAKAKKLKESQK